MKYDEDGKLTSVTTCGLKEDANTYENDNLIQGVNGGEQLTSAAAYTDDDNRLASVTDATGQTLSYAYSGAVSQMTGQPTSVTDAAGVITISFYDNRGHITRNFMVTYICKQCFHEHVVH